MNPLPGLGDEHRLPVKRARSRHFAFAFGFRAHPRNRLRGPIRLDFCRDIVPAATAAVHLLTLAGGLDLNPKNSFQPAPSPAGARLGALLLGQAETNQ
jgi:hypothetical protein